MGGWVAGVAHGGWTRCRPRGRQRAKQGLAHGRVWALGVCTCQPAPQRKWHKLLTGRRVSEELAKTSDRIRVSRCMIGHMAERAVGCAVGCLHCGAACLQGVPRSATLIVLVNTPSKHQGTYSSFAHSSRAVLATFFVWLEPNRSGSPASNTRHSAAARYAPAALSRGALAISTRAAAKVWLGGLDCRALGRHPATHACSVLDHSHDACMCVHVCQGPPTQQQSAGAPLCRVLHYVPVKPQVC